MDELASLKNIGTKTAQWLTEVGINTPQELHAIGAVEAWKRLEATPHKLSLVGLYALQGAILDIHWNALPDDMKADLRRQIGRE